MHNPSHPLQNAKKPPTPIAATAIKIGGLLPLSHICLNSCTGKKYRINSTVCTNLYMVQHLQHQLIRHGVDDSGLLYQLHQLLRTISCQRICDSETCPTESIMAFAFAYVSDARMPFSAAWILAMRWSALLVPTMAVVRPGWLIVYRSSSELGVSPVSSSED